LGLSKNLRDAKAQHFNLILGKAHSIDLGETYDLMTCANLKPGEVCAHDL
jgi:hypothetical protein